MILMAAANNYFPFAPGDYYNVHELEGFLLPVLLPDGIDGYSLAAAYSDYLGMMTLTFEGELQPTISEVDKDHLKLELISPSEPSYQAYMEWYLDNNTGITRYFYMYEEYDGEEFIATIFKKNRTAVSPILPIDTFILDNYLVPDINITIDIESLFPYEFMEAMLHKNPVNSSMPSGIGTPIFFTDIFTINSTPDPYNMTFKIELPSKYNVAYMKYIAMYIYDIENDGSEESAGIWEYDLLNDIEFGTVTRDSQNNILILELENVNGSIAIILAWMYSGPIIAPSGGGGGGGDGDDEQPAEIPGYDISLLISIISLISIIFYIEKRKKF
jgi:hypothetical protein